MSVVVWTMRRARPPTLDLASSRFPDQAEGGATAANEEAARRRWDGRVDGGGDRPWTAAAAHISFKSPGAAQCPDGGAHACRSSRFEGARPRGEGV